MSRITFQYVPPPLWGICISTGAAAASDVTASSCAGYSAATVSYWLRRVLQSDGRPQARSGDLPAPQSSKQEGGQKRVLGGTRQASNPRRRKRRVRGANDRDTELRHHGAEDWVSSLSGVGAEPGRKKRFYCFLSVSTPIALSHRRKKIRLSRLGRFFSGLAADKKSASRKPYSLKHVYSD